MSEMETHKGKLVPMTFWSPDTEQQAKEACNKFGLERSESHDSWLDCLKDEGYLKAFIHPETDIIYEIQDIELDPNGFDIANQNSDGSIDYFISYYNGGASFDEVIETAIKDLNE